MTILGCVADDFTGAADMASFLKKGGMRTLLLDGTPEEMQETDQADAIVIALKTRTQETEKAVSLSLDALHWLKRQNCSHFYIKYCSTFDSTQKGNIGPVCDAAMDFLQVKSALICPALPVNGRTVEQGNLYVNGTLLQDSSMKDHPLTPMRDSNLKRLMEAQSRYFCLEFWESIKSYLPSGPVLVYSSAAPGVPVMTPVGNRCLRLVLKSGNFGNAQHLCGFMGNAMRAGYFRCNAGYYTLPSHETGNCGLCGVCHARLKRII